MAVTWYGWGGVRVNRSKKESKQKQKQVAIGLGNGEEDVLFCYFSCRQRPYMFSLTTRVLPRFYGMHKVLALEGLLQGEEVEFEMAFNLVNGSTVGPSQRSLLLPLTQAGSRYATTLTRTFDARLPAATTHMYLLVQALPNLGSTTTWSLKKWQSATPRSSILLSLLACSSRGQRTVGRRLP